MMTLRTVVTLSVLLAAALLVATAVGHEGSERGGRRLADGTGPEAPPSTTGTSPSPSTSTTAPGAGGEQGGADERPPATGLDPGLVAAFERARRAAADAGHQLVINSGHRTAAYQQELLDREVAARGSLEEATRWVFPPERSMHVQGLAIDVGDGPAADWLAAEGARFGLCHTLAWEWWHFEWRARWEADGTCPAPATDPSGAPGI